jgi:hypothetical protein
MHARALRKIVVATVIAVAGTCAVAIQACAKGTQVSYGWRVTVYHTAVESFHHGPLQAVEGCLDPDCSAGQTAIGNYPADFNRAVMEEGAGRITSGSQAGMYLNWSYDVGYWLDTIPSDSRGRPLIPYSTAAADPNVLPYGAQVRLLSCGVDSVDGTVPDSAVCTKLRSVTWTVRDRFTPGLGGAKHLDLYIGEEDQPDFEHTSPKVIDVRGVTLVRLSQ